MDSLRKTKGDALIQGSQGVALMFAGALALGLLAAAPLLAQTLTGTEPVQYQVTPASPGPRGFVVIEVRGVGSFLGDSNITWSKDGSVVESGTGLSRYSFTTGEVGERTTVSVTIETVEYGVLERTFRFNPSSVELLWEADTATPPFYRGLPLMSAGARVRIAAFPAVRAEGGAVAPADLSYRWFLNGEPQLSASGLGRRTFTFSGSQLREGEEVRLEVTNGGVPAGQATLFIPTSAPLLVLYPKDPLRGVRWETALGASARLSGQETIVHAEPYFFSRESAQRGSLTYHWSLEGQDASGPESERGELTLRVAGQGGGAANLFVSLQNMEDDKLLQSASAAVSILFGESGNPFTNLFGI